MMSIRHVGTLMLALAILPITSPTAHTLHVSNDAYVLSREVNENTGSEESIRLQSDRLGTHAYFKFDLSKMSGQMRADFITSASLRVWLSEVKRPGTLAVHRVRSDWTERTVTFDTAPDADSKSFQMIDITSDDERNFVVADVTALVKEWITRPARNFGIVLIPAGVWVEIDTKENNRTSHPAEIEILMRTPPETVEFQRLSVDVVVPGNSSRSRDVVCHKGWKVISGGLHSRSNSTRLRSSFPLNENTWQVQVFNTAGSSTNVSIYALCQVIR